MKKIDALFFSLLFFCSLNVSATAWNIGPSYDYTTPNAFYLADIAGLDAERNPLAEFDPSIADQTFYKDYFPSGRFNEYVNAPQLSIGVDGRIKAHNGRHRAALLKKAGGINIPVLLEIRPEKNRLLNSIFDNKFTTFATAVTSAVK